MYVQEHQFLRNRVCTGTLYRQEAGFHHPDTEYGPTSHRVDGAGAQFAGVFLDYNRVWRCVVSGKVVARDTHNDFATDVLLLNGTHLRQSGLQCQPGVQACHATIRRQNSLCGEFRK